MRWAGLMTVILIFTISMFLFAGCATSHKTRDVVWPISLDMPTDYRMAVYLGFFKPQKSFLLTEIKAEILIANVFQSRCPHCQGLSRDLNELYNLIIKERLINRVKIIGLGYGDDFFEVEEFRKRYAVQYPVFADPLADKVKVKHIPAVFILKMTPSGARVLYEYYGIIPEPHDLIDILRGELGSTS